MNNIILQTIQSLGLVLVTLIIISMTLVQYLKEKWGIEGKAAEIASLVVGFVLGALVVVSYLDQLNWSASVSQWVGIFLFLVVATLGPSGGYKTLRALVVESREKLDLEESVELWKDSGK